MRRIMIYDDVRFIRLAIVESNFVEQKNDVFSLVRPFRHDGERVVCDHENAINMITNNNLPFDVWILDNDLGPGVEGFDFLKLACEHYPSVVPGKVYSCSRNHGRRVQIESYHRDWIRTR